MKVLLFGLVLIAAAVCSVLPAGLGWWGDVAAFLRGGLPVIALGIGVFSVYTGIKGRAGARKKDGGEPPKQG